MASFPEEALYPSLLVVMDICKPYIIKNVLDKQKIYIYSYDINRLGNFFNPFLHLYSCSLDNCYSFQLVSFHFHLGFILSTRLGSSHDNSLARLKICIIFFIVFKSCLQSLAKNICSK